MRRRKLSPEQVREVHKLRALGLSFAQIGARYGCSWITVYRVAPGPGRGVRSGRPKDEVRIWHPGPGRLGLDEREEIGRGLVAGETLSAIAARLGRNVSTISREVCANGGREDYRAWRAHRRAYGRARRPKAAKLDDPTLCTQVSEWLTALYSPEQIALRLRFEFPDDPMKWVSHETIYQSLFVQGRGELRRELARCLRSGRTKRRPRSRARRGERIKDMVMISERPAEAADRAVPGHWEGDLVIGANGRSAVGTLVERTSRYMLLLHLPGDHGAEAVDAAMRRAIAKLPSELFRTITWDQGIEMARHATFTVDTGIQVYFCDPHSPWQRPTNENTNGLLRQYLPKGTDLSKFSEADLDAIARNMNDRPRKVLGGMKPVERLSAILAHTG
ncbi:MAG TPA: IS30 family transposase [Acidimicrobiales bacterium]|nr:IS30 family transposase [Acidimicrobiales bacterium]